MCIVTDKLKDAVVAKIAMQASDLYADAYSNMLVGSVKQMWDKVRDSIIQVYFSRSLIQCTVIVRLLMPYCYPLPPVVMVTDCGCQAALFPCGSPAQTR